METINNGLVDFRIAVKTIKLAILKSQYRAAKSVNYEQLSLYFGIGRYISENSRKGFWGKGAIERISEQLQRELPGLRGFSGTSLKKMRQFYEEWAFLIRPPMAGELEALNRPPMANDLKLMDKNVIDDSFLMDLNKGEFNHGFDLNEFLSVSFSHHIEILNKTEALEERIFYIHQAFINQWDKYKLRDWLKADLYHHQGMMPNNLLIQCRTLEMP